MAGEGFITFLENLISELKQLHWNENLEIIVEQVENKEIIDLLSCIPDITGYHSKPDDFK